MIVVSVTLVGLTALAHSRASQDEHWRNRYGPKVDLWAQREAEVIDHYGSSGLEQYVSSFVKSPGVYTYMFDEGGREVLQQKVPSQVAKIAVQVGESGSAEPQFFTKDRIIGEKTVGPSGRSYVVVVTYPQPSVLRRRLFEFLVVDVRSTGGGRLTAILLVGGVFCFWLARQIVNPIDKLRLATREITNEHLETRVDEKVLTRHDELADLGRDLIVWQNGSIPWLQLSAVYSPTSPTHFAPRWLV